MGVVDVEVEGGAAEFDDRAGLVGFGTGGFGQEGDGAGDVEDVAGRDDAAGRELAIDGPVGLEASQEVYAPLRVMKGAPLGGVPMVLPLSAYCLRSWV